MTIYSLLRNASIFEDYIQLNRQTKFLVIYTSVQCEAHRFTALEACMVSQIQAYSRGKEIFSAIQVSGTEIRKT